jgi:sigma-B regulation protein RsbU (phosphoserine phosphatase)
MSRARILVVDDEPAMLRGVERILGEDHEVRGSLSSLKALSIAREFEPHIAVIDIRMGEMDGFELMNELKAIDGDVQVILMTGSVFDIDDKLSRAIREKAFYYISKPFDRQVLLTLVDRCLELREVEEANRRHVAHLESQLAEVRAFQDSMLPPREAIPEGLRICAAYQPCVEVAGDLYDYAAVESGVVSLVIADVAGHGASAAMLTGIVKSAFRSSYYADRYDPLAVVRRVSDGIAAFEPHRFVTLICARISLADATVEYVNAGHDGGLIVSGGNSVTMLEATGPLISPALRGANWERRKLGWEPESLVLLYTDGVSEAAESGEVFGSGRIVSAAVDGAADAGKLVKDILLEVGRFTGGRQPEDDMTLLAAQGSR